MVVSNVESISELTLGEMLSDVCSISRINCGLYCDSQ
jgi:hypothetical protein